MSVLTFATNDLFVIRIIKHYSTNPARQWSNSWEAVANESGTFSDLRDLGEAIIAFEQLVHNTFTVLDRLVISTWAADSVPYDPSAFYTQPINLPAVRDTTGELEPITTCWSVSRDPLSGRQGHLFFRGVLSQADTSAPSGITVLSSPSTMATLLSSSLTDSALADYVSVTPINPLSIAMVNKTGSNIRAVAGLTSVGVVQLPVDHAWFNRTSP